MDCVLKNRSLLRRFDGKLQPVFSQMIPENQSFPAQPSILTGPTQAMITYRFLRARYEAKSHFAKPNLNHRIVALSAHPFFFGFAAG
jgi:hypothetical protein